jgi:heterodisulfide reductase subunit A
MIDGKEAKALDANAARKAPSEEVVGAVAVVGGGVGGVQAALDLAESGYKVYLLEASPAIGGVMAQLDKTFPTNDCSMCILSPKLVECGRHRTIEVLTLSRVEGIEGEAGHFRLSVRQDARYVDAAKCVACGLCAEKCPSKAEDAFNEGLKPRKAIYIPYPQAVPLTYAIDPASCRYLTKGKCRVCEKVCPAEAISFDDEAKAFELHVGAILLVPGFQEFSPKAKYHYGFGRFPNVVTSIQFERILSASGPFGGHVERPSDGKTPKRLAFIQCVGSRDVKVGRPYCSAVCCMYAIKEAIIAKEHDPSLDITVFFMDMRAYGKGFDAYFEQAQREHGITFVRSNVSLVKETGDDGNLLVEFAEEEGPLKEEAFDIVILSVGLEPSPATRRTAALLGIDLNDYGFCRTHELAPLQTTKGGIFAAGAFQGPKDIPETVTQASGAAGCASVLLADKRKSLVAAKDYPPELDVSRDEPRIGVFVCHCGINIGGVVDVKEVREYASTLPHVVFAEENLYTCSQDTQLTIAQRIKEHGLNRIIVAACTPRTHEPLFQETLREAGLNKYLFEMANIRDQCSWVHMEEKERATLKAKDLVRMAVSKARWVEPLEGHMVDMNPSALVIGGGVAGMTAALNLARQGFPVHLVEKEPSLGGIARRIHFTLKGESVAAFLDELVTRVLREPNISVYCESSTEESSGYMGNFVTRIARGREKEMETVEHGVVILATGGLEATPQEYCYGESGQVLTLTELEEAIAGKDRKVTQSKNLVLIQCVGSRCDERPYCSRVCCSKSLKLALQLKRLVPRVNTYVLYRDMRTYGFKEELYQEAREKGVCFIRYDPEIKPTVRRIETEEGETLLVKVKDPILGEELLIEADLVGLATAVTAPKENKELSQLFKVPLTQEGFFLEAHMKLRPVDFSTEGVFMCGLAHAPKFLEESIAQAEAAASRATTVLTKEKVLSEAVVARIDKDRCSGCKLCIGVCPFEAISFSETENVATVNEVLCKGCGCCAACCPSAACSVANFTDQQILAAVEAMAEAL